MSGKSDNERILESLELLHTKVDRVAEDVKGHGVSISWLKWSVSGMLSAAVAILAAYFHRQ